MEIKICGLTRAREAAYLNHTGADYAGFVFHPPSKRNLTAEGAKEILAALSPQIQRVAVTVSPDAARVRELEALGFDFLQIHGELSREVLEAATLPVWYAVNLTEPSVLAEKEKALAGLPEVLRRKIVGIVVDGANYGGGITFGWDDTRWRSSPIFENRRCILAGGLNAENVQTGIRLFAPDVVDVSSGVEGADGKDEAKIEAFVRKVREDE